MIPKLLESIFINDHASDQVTAPADTLDILNTKTLRAIPEIARNEQLCSRLMTVAQSIRTRHEFYNSDSRDLTFIPDRSVHLVVTSPPYWNLKPYEESNGQLGVIDDYDEFVEQLDRVFRECYRVLVPGGRAVIVIGDVLVPRKVFGRHLVFPLHGTVQENSRKAGFDNLAPIIWNKIGNVQTEAGGSANFLGKPFEPNAIIKNDIEYILFQRKPGDYRHVTPDQRLTSLIPQPEYAEWFNQIWTLPGESTRSHPAPYPLELAERLVRMFSFTQDTVLDPFSGSGTTAVAAAKWGRNSVNVDIEKDYVEKAKRRLLSVATQPNLFDTAN